MKKIVFILLVLVFALFSCNQQNKETHVQQSRIDSLEVKLSQVYKPGFGEFMSYMQAHHAKLWYAGQNKNWKLANFEMDEIKEAFDDIKTYETDRKESQLIPIINPALDSISSVIRREDAANFNNAFTYLTNTCNSCHKAAQFEFNVVKIPDLQTFSNQDFKTVQ